MLRVVLDTSVIASALRSRRGASNALLRAAAGGRIRPLVTTALFLEYEAVLKRPEQRLVHGLTLAEIDMFMAAFASASEGVEVTFRWRPTMRDPNDEMVLEAAVNGRADALASHNVRDFHDAALRFDVRVVTPGILLREISP